MVVLRSQRYFAPVSSDHESVDAAIERAWHQCEANTAYAVEIVDKDTGEVLVPQEELRRRIREHPLNDSD